MSHLLKLKRGHDESEDDYSTDDDGSVVTSGEEDYSDEGSYGGETTDEDEAGSEEEADLDVERSTASQSIKQAVDNSQINVENNQIVETKRELNVDMNQNDNTLIVDSQQVDKETVVITSQSVISEEIAYTETVSQPSVENVTQKRIQEHREYRRKLEEDPSFVPYVGLFWGHDDRYREDGLAETRSPSALTEPRFSNVSGSNNHRATEYQRQLDPLMYKKWDHSGYEELLRLEEEDERRKRELIESGQLDPNAEYKPNNHLHHKQRYPSRGRGRGGYQHQGQRYPRNHNDNNNQNRYNSTPKDEWPDLNQSINTEKAEGKNSTWEPLASWKNTDGWGVNIDRTPSPPKTTDSGMVNAWGSVDRVEEIEPIVNKKPIITDGWGVPSTNATIESIEDREKGTTNNSGWEVDDSSAKKTPQQTGSDLPNSANTNPGDWADKQATNDNSWDDATNDRNNTTTTSNSDWNTTNNDWINATTTSQNTNHHREVGRKGGWNRSPLKRDDTKMNTEEIPIEEKASSSWANVTPDVEVSTTPSSWTRRNYNKNDRYAGRGNYTKNNSHEGTSHWRKSNNPSKVSSPAITTEDVTKNWDNTPSVAITTTGWGEQISSSTAELSEIRVTDEVNKESSGWGKPSITIASGWGEPSTASTSGWGESSKTTETVAVPSSSTAVTSSWDEPSKSAATTTASASTLIEPPKPTTTTTASIANSSSGWDEPATNVDIAVRTTTTAKESSDSAKSTIIASEPSLSSGWGETPKTSVPDKTSDWDKPAITDSWNDANVTITTSSIQDTATTKDKRSHWNTPFESSGWGEPVCKESTPGGWSNNRSNNSSNWNSDREANNKVKLSEQPPRKGRGYLSQKMESSLSSSPSPPIIVEEQEKLAEASGSAWERFHDQGDSDSDVEIILEAEEEPEWLKHEQVLGMTAPNDGTEQFQATQTQPPPSSILHTQVQSPLTSTENSPRSKQVYRQYDSSSPRPESSRKYSSNNKNLRKPRRNFDDNWRQRDDHHSDEQQQYNNNGTTMYYPAPVNGTSIAYVPMIPNANGSPMYAMPFPLGTSPTGQSISPHHGEDSNRSSSPQQFYPSPPTVGPNGAIQLPPGYEANGMVYYGMDPSVMYPPQPFYYYAAPMPMGSGNNNNNTNGSLPPQQQVMYHSLPAEDLHHLKVQRSSPQQHVVLEEEDGWGPSPSIQEGEGEWSNNKKSSPLMDTSSSRYNNSNNSSPYYFYQ